jgi:signal transduction histidine kinase
MSTSESHPNPTTRYLTAVLVALLIGVGLYLTSLYSFLLFHTLAEFFSIIIAGTVFVLAWNARGYISSGYLLFIGISFLFVGIIDTVHTLAYSGMGVLLEFDANLPTQLWIAGRYMQSLSFLAAFFFIRRQVRASTLIAIFTTITTLIFVSVLKWNIFPTAFIEGVGLTPFKIYSEYVIIALLAASIFFLHKNKAAFEPDVRRYLVAALIFSMLAELAFTFYIDIYDLSNLIGHYFKIAAFFFIYKAIIETGFIRPYNLLLRDYKDREETLIQNISLQKRLEQQAKQAANVAEQRANELDAERARLKTIIETSPVGIVVADKDMNVILSNPAARALIPDLTRGSPVFEPEAYFLITPEGEPLQMSDRSLQRSIQSGKSYTNIEAILSKPGEPERSLLVNTAPISDERGAVIGAVSLFQDITGRKQVEAELERYAARLEHSNTELQEFAFVVSHDLQEPLRKIRAFGDRLARHAGPRLEEEEQDFLNRMTNAAQRMQTMIDDLLAYSRIITKANPFEQVDLNQVVQGVLSDLEVRIERSGGQMQVDELPVIEADAMQIRQLLQNLLSNALKYHHPGTPPQVHIFAETNEQIVALYVKDNGIGFDPVHSQRIFQPFERLHGRSAYEGTGMGLAICRKIVERHNGQISAKSQPGKGATFITILPVHQPMPAEEATQA